MSKTVNLAVLVILSVLLLAGTTARAEIFTVELPEFLGPLEENGTTKTVSFDFGTSFLQIYDVRIQLEGAFTPGPAHGDGLVVPEDIWSDVPGAIDVYMEPGDGVCVAGALVDESPFVMEEAFQLFFGAS